MNFSELDFEALEDIPPLRRHYDVPRISITEKGMVSMNGALKRGVEAKGISLPALYTMEWCQERRAWIGCCQDLPEPPALSALDQPKKVRRSAARRSR